MFSNNNVALGYLKQECFMLASLTKYVLQYINLLVVMPQRYRLLTDSHHRQQFVMQGCVLPVRIKHIGMLQCSEPLILCRRFLLCYDSKIHHH